MLAVPAGDRGTGWGLTLAAHHALVVGAWFSEAGEWDIFQPAGDFRCPHWPPPMGTAEPTPKAEEWYPLPCTWGYCSGIAHATHFMGNAMVAGTIYRDRRRHPAGPVTVLDDWGGGVHARDGSSGSTVSGPRRCSCPRTAPRRGLAHHDAPGPGAALHGNPLYCGRIYGVTTRAWSSR